MVLSYRGAECRFFRRAEERKFREIFMGGPEKAFIGSLKLVCTDSLKAFIIVGLKAV